MPTNKFHARYNFDSHVENAHTVEDYSFSNMMYDQHKGISHALLPYSENSEITRFVSDVELCMSQDPNIVSRFSAEHRDMLKKQLSSQPRTSISDGVYPSDDELLQNGGIRSLERDEIVRCAKANYNRLDAELPFPAPVPAPSPAVESSKVE